MRSFPIFARLVAGLCGAAIIAAAFGTATFVASVEPGRPAPLFIAVLTIAGGVIGTGYWLLAFLPQSTSRQNRIVRRVAAVILLVPLVLCVGLSIVTSSRLVLLGCAIGFVATAWLSWGAFRGSFSLPKSTETT